MTPEEARWLEKYFGPDIGSLNPEWVASTDLEEWLGDLAGLPSHDPITDPAKALLEEIKGVNPPLRAEFFAYWDPAKLRKNVGQDGGILSSDDWNAWRQLPRDERGRRPKQPTPTPQPPATPQTQDKPTGASSMPASNLESRSNGR